MNRKTATTLFYALLLAVVANVVVFGLASLLSGERRRPQDITEPVSVDLIQLKPPEPLKPEEIVDPEPPKPRPQLDFIPELAPPTLAGPGAIDVAISLDPLLFEGRAQTGGLIFDESELDRPPTPRTRMAPVYPYKARQRRIEGSVTVKILVHADGSVSKVEILEAKPRGLFEEAVLKAVPQWTFEPGVIAGQPVTAWVSNTIRFDLSR